MRYGTVVQFFPVKGFGFIRADYGPDIFFHVTALGACQSPPQINVGQPVKYELVPRAEAKAKRQAREDGESPPPDKKPVRPEARLVELIDRIPGASMDDTPVKREKHPKARHKKPTWRP